MGSFVAAGAKAEAASGDVTLSAPASPLTDDVWIAVVYTYDQNAHTFTDWTQVFQGNGAGLGGRLSVWWFRYAGSAPNLIITHSAGDTIVGGIAAFRSVPSGNPIDVTGTGGSGSDTSIELTGVTPASSGAMLIACDGSTFDNSRPTPPTGFTPAFEDAAVGTQNCYVALVGSDASVALHYKTHTSGATGDFTDTQSTADQWASVLFALVGDSTTYVGVLA